MSNIFSIKNLKLEKKIKIFSWIIKIRKLGKIIFLIIQDSSGIIQSVIKDEKLIIKSKKIKNGDLLKIEGIIKKKDDFNKEVEIKKFEIINKSKKIPFINKQIINEETRYKNRFLDLRLNLRSKNIIQKKSLFLINTRSYFNKKNFLEIETPILSQKSPEGSNCFLVPSNLKNKYYTLSQSPQIFKQLLMISGFDKYYQIAKCFRNEDSRSNRQIEFLQLDVEKNFTTVSELKKIIEKFLKIIIKKTFDYEIEIPFKSFKYKDSIKKYNTDKPNLSKELKKEFNFVWITDWPLFKYDNKKKKIDSFRHPFTSPKKKYINLLMENKIDFLKVTSESFDLICNGEEIISGGIRIYFSKLQKKILEIIGYKEKEIKKYFGYFLNALEFAAPPHGGFGMGIDRLLSVLLKTKNLKELLTFPKNIDGTCSLTGTPDYNEF